MIEEDNGRFSESASAAPLALPDAVRELDSTASDSEVSDSGVASQKNQPEPPDADTEAFNRFLAGSDESFRALYDAYERPLYLYVVRVLGSSRDAEDVFQEVWTRMFRLRGEKATVQRFTGLLFTVARNLSINAIRDRKLHPEISMDEANPDLMVRSGNVEDSDLRDMLERALLQIPIAQREAFILREYFGYSYEEMATMTGATMVTSKTRAWRARERLRKVIAAWMELKNSGD